VDTLRRVQDTPALGHLSPAERRALVAEAFTVTAGDPIRGGRIVVVDDVMTSGATLAACARTLLDAGAREVRVVALARAL
jgi:predicted amidophosphoribosyltransferase